METFIKQVRPFLC